MEKHVCIMTHVYLLGSVCLLLTTQNVLLKSSAFLCQVGNMLPFLCIFKVTPHAFTYCQPAVMCALPTASRCKVIYKEWHVPASPSLHCCVPAEEKILQCRRRHDTALCDCVHIFICFITMHTKPSLLWYYFSWPYSALWLSNTVQKCCLTVAVSLSRAFPLVAVTAVFTPLQGGQSTVHHTVGLRAPLGAVQPVLPRGWLWRRGQIYKHSLECLL